MTLRPLAAAVTFSVAALATHHAFAFCLTTTCNPEIESCTKGEGGCLTIGRQLYWSSSCIPFSVQEDASELHDISYEDFAAAVQRAFDTWSKADCGDGERPSFQALDVGPVSCEAPEYNQTGRNASVFMFRDDSWPYANASDSLGRTSLSFDRGTGELYDADVEINGTATLITTQTSSSGVDLESIVVHEVGHFLGLGHSDEQGAVMYPGYASEGVTRRALTADDVSAICAAFPPGRVAESTNCEPRHGFSAECLVDQTPVQPEIQTPPSENRKASGCSIGANSVRGSRRFGEPYWLLAGTLVALRRLRRRRH